MTAGLEPRFRAFSFLVCAGSCLPRRVVATSRNRRRAASCHDELLEVVRRRVRQSTIQTTQPENQFPFVLLDGQTNPALLLQVLLVAAVVAVLVLACSCSGGPFLQRGDGAVRGRLIDLLIGLATAMRALQNASSAV